MLQAIHAAGSPGVGERASELAFNIGQITDWIFPKPVE